jgi:LysM repeat protein
MSTEINKVEQTSATEKLENPIEQKEEIKAPDKATLQTFQNELNNSQNETTETTSKTDTDSATNNPAQTESDAATGNEQTDTDNNKNDQTGSNDATNNEQVDNEQTGSINNDDGVVDTIFDRVDTNSDGTLDSKELFAGQMDRLISYGGQFGNATHWEGLVDKFGDKGVTRETFTDNAQIFQAADDDTYDKGIQNHQDNVAAIQQFRQEINKNEETNDGDNLLEFRDGSHIDTPDDGIMGGLFDRLDTDGDGSLNGQELFDGQSDGLIGLKGQVGVPPEFSKLAENAGGSVSRDLFVDNARLFQRASTENKLVENPPQQDAINIPTASEDLTKSRKNYNYDTAEGLQAWKQDKLAYTGNTELSNQDIEELADRIYKNADNEYGLTKIETIAKSSRLYDDANESPDPEGYNVKTFLNRLPENLYQVLKPADGKLLKVDDINGLLDEYTRLQPFQENELIQKRLDTISEELDQYRKARDYQSSYFDSGAENEEWVDNEKLNFRYENGLQNFKQDLKDARYEINGNSYSVSELLNNINENNHKNHVAGVNSQYGAFDPHDRKSRSLWSKIRNELSRFDDNVLQPVKNEVSDHLSKIDDVILQPIGDLGSKIDDEVLQEIGELGSKIDDEVLQPIKEGISDGLSAYEDALKDLGSKIDDEVLQKIKEGAEDLGEDIEDGIRELGKHLDDLIYEPFKEEVLESEWYSVVSTALKFAPPPVNAIGYGMDIVQGIYLSGSAARDGDWSGVLDGAVQIAAGMTGAGALNVPIPDDVIKIAQNVQKLDAASDFVEDPDFQNFAQLAGKLAGQDHSQFVDNLKNIENAANLVEAVESGDVEDLTIAFLQTTGGLSGDERLSQLGDQAQYTDQFVQNLEDGNYAAATNAVLNLAESTGTIEKNTDPVFSEEEPFTNLTNQTDIPENNAPYTGQRIPTSEGRPTGEGWLLDPATNEYVYSPNAIEVFVNNETNNTADTAHWNLDTPDALTATLNNSATFASSAPSINSLDAKADTATLTIPAGSTLSQIAADNDTTVEAILAVNPNITNANHIQANQVLNLPDIDTTPANEANLSTVGGGSTGAMTLAAGLGAGALRNPELLSIALQGAGALGSSARNTAAALSNPIAAGISLAAYPSAVGGDTEKHYLTDPSDPSKTADNVRISIQSDETVGHLEVKNEFTGEWERSPVTVLRQPGFYDENQPYDVSPSQFTLADPSDVENLGIPPFNVSNVTPVGKLENPEAEKLNASTFLPATHNAPWSTTFPDQFGLNGATSITGSPIPNSEGIGNIMMSRPDLEWKDSDWKAVEESGLPRDVAEGVSDAAHEGDFHTGIVIGSNAASNPLIEAGHPTKGIDNKEKSSIIGPEQAILPYDKDGNRTNSPVIPYITTATQEPVEYVKTQDGTTLVKVGNTYYDAKTNERIYNDQISSEELSSPQPIMVVGDLETGLRMVSDHDTLVIAPNGSNYTNDELYKVQDFGKPNGIGTQAELSILESLQANTGASIGLPQTINHLPETGNPEAESMGRNFPATVFTPDGSVVTVNSEQEYMYYSNNGIQNGYVFRPNPAWNWEQNPDGQFYLPENVKD